MWRGKTPPGPGGTWLGSRGLGNGRGDNTSWLAGGGGHLVAQPDVGERAADHHLVVAAAGAVGVEVALLDAVLVEVQRRRRALLDRARGRDVVGGDGVAELGQHARALDVLRRLRRLRDLLEERGAAHVGG